MVYNYYMTFNVEDKLGVLLGQPDEHADFGMLASAGGTVCKPYMSICEIGNG